MPDALTAKQSCEAAIVAINRASGQPDDHRAQYDTTYSLGRFVGVASEGYYARLTRLSGSPWL